MERKIQPVQPIRRTRAVRGIRPVKLHRRPRYRSKLKANLFDKRFAIEKPEPETSVVNHAHYAPEGVGGHIDFKG
jgi:hypothetical protein